jgi:hypothetical protein
VHMNEAGMKEGEKTRNYSSSSEAICATPNRWRNSLNLIFPSGFVKMSAGFWVPGT